MTSQKPEWFEITEKGDTYAGIQKVNKKLPIITLVVAGAVILGGSIFANANNEPSAVAETPTASQSMAATTSSSNATTPSVNSSQSASLPVPTVTNVPQRGDGDREGREHHDGDRPDFKDGDREHHDGDHEFRDND
jgi:hypothetical protein